MTGNRKKKKKTKPIPGTRRGWIRPLPTKFDCPFCNQVESCQVTMDKVRHVGRVWCTVCRECFLSPVHNLSEPIDVFNDWIDACEEANRDQDKDRPAQRMETSQTNDQQEYSSD